MKKRSQTDEKMESNRWKNGVEQMKKWSCTDEKMESNRWRLLKQNCHLFPITNVTDPSDKVT